MQVTFIGLMTLLFIGLKLTNHIDWSWWLVLSPFWGSFLLTFVIFFCYYLYIAYASADSKVKKRNRK